MFKPTSIADCIARYGPVCTDPAGGLIWKEAPTWVKPVAVPDAIVLRNYLGKPVRWIFANTDIHKPLTDAFLRVVIAGCAAEMKTYDGCFNVRFVRGMPGMISLHSFAIAIDFNAKDNPMGAPGKWSDEFLHCFEKAGFTNGGSFGRKDFMHFQIKEIPNGRSDKTV